MMEGRWITRRPSTMTRPRALLSRQDWIDAGQELLRKGGITSVKLSPLLGRLGVTSGSFYHHFADFGAFLDALADDYGTVHLERIAAAIESEDPSERIREMRRLMEAWAAPDLDRAMRVWATSNERAAQAVKRLDGQLLTILETSLIELGFSAEEARLRALVMFAAGAGRSLIFTPWDDDPDAPRQALELLLTPLPPGSPALGSAAASDDAAA